MRSMTAWSFNIDHRVNVVRFKKKHGLGDAAGETVQNEPIVPIMLIQARPDHLFHNVIGHQLAAVHDAVDARGQLGMTLDVPAKNVAYRDVNELRGT
jgi:hypothetical protein